MWDPDLPLTHSLGNRLVLHSYRWGVLPGDRSAEDGVRKDASAPRPYTLRWKRERKT